MPFPWKKVKNTRISQLVKDHVHSQRNGGSLMVETGFPTSLVDLVVKNRDRFKKPSKKKMPPKVADPLISPCPSPPSPENLPSPVALPSPPPVAPFSPSRVAPLSPSLRPNSNIERPQLRTSDEVFPLIRKGESERTDVGDGGVDMNRGLVAVLKIFLVVILVLGTKNLVVGITLSAFLLFFLEYFGDSLYRLLKPCSEVQRRVVLMVQGIWKVLTAKLVKLEEEEDCVFKAPLRDQELVKPDSSDFGYRIQEIQVVQPNCYLAPHVEEIQCVQENIDDECSCDTELICEGMDVEGVVMEKGEECMCELPESKEKKSHRARMKSKMKKLVPKKLRRRKGLKLENQMIPNSIDDDAIIEEKKELEGSSEFKLKSNGTVSSAASGIDDEINGFEDVGSVGEAFEGLNVGESSKGLDVGCVGESCKGLTVGSVEESCKGIAKATIKKEDSSIEREHNSAYIALLLVVLAGLIGGRILALVFTLTWCVMSKRGGAIRRYTKFPVIRSFLAGKFS